MKFKTKIITFTSLILTIPYLFAFHINNYNGIQMIEYIAIIYGIILAGTYVFFHYLLKPFSNLFDISKANSLDSVVDSVKKALHTISYLTKEAEKTEEEILLLLTNAGEKRSDETGKHIKRVAEYVGFLAALKKLPAYEVEIVKSASKLHDLGKIGIRDDVLHKHGKLTDEEYNEMKRHPIIGAELLEASNRPLIQAAKVICLEHHEKFDGTGYPYRRKGDEIHLYARITAIADVFDALSNDRCYKKAWNKEQIVSFFEEEKGKHFDPELTELFLNNVDKFYKIQTKYEDD